eukprot:symbB.v1.2.006174.t1/scaffold367.1/size382069/7
MLAQRSVPAAPELTPAPSFSPQPSVSGHELPGANLSPDGKLSPGFPRQDSEDKGLETALEHPMHTTAQTLDPTVGQHTEGLRSPESGRVEVELQPSRNEAVEETKEETSEIPQKDEEKENRRERRKKRKRRKRRKRRQEDAKGTLQRSPSRGTRSATQLQSLTIEVGMS